MVSVPASIQRWSPTVPEPLTDFAAEERGQTTAGGMIRVGVEVIVAVTIAAILAAFLLPVGIDEIAAVDTSSWSDAATSLFDLLQLAFVLVIFLVAIGWAVRSFR